MRFVNLVRIKRSLLDGTTFTIENVKANIQPTDDRIEIEDGVFTTGMFVGYFYPDTDIKLNDKITDTDTGQEFVVASIQDLARQGLTVKYQEVILKESDIERQS